MRFQKLFVGAVTAAVTAGCVVTACPVAVAAAGSPAKQPAVLNDTVASRAFDRVKPAVVRVESHRSATYRITLPDFSGDKFKAFVQSDVRRVLDRGVAGPSQLVDNVYRDATAEISAHPDEFFSPGTDSRSTTVSDDTAASGFIVSADGVVVTSSFAVPENGQAIERLHDRAASELRSNLQAEDDGAAEDLSSALVDQGPGITVDPAVASGFANALITAGTNVALGTVTASEGPTISTVVELGPATAGASPGPSVYTATVVSADGGLDRPGVTLLRIKASGLPNAGLATGAPALFAGEGAVIAGYDPSTASTPVRPTRSQGTVKIDSASGASSLDAGFSDGKVGGPMLDQTGRVVGVAVGPSALAGADAISTALAKAKIVPVVNPQMLVYQRAIDQYVRQHYRRALPRLVHLAAVAPSFPYVQDLIRSSRAAIAAGKDRTPATLPIGLVIAAIAANVFSTSGIVLLGLAARRRRNSPLDVLEVSTAVRIPVPVAAGAAPALACG